MPRFINLLGAPQRAALASSHDAREIALAVAFLGWCACLLAARVAWTRTLSYGFLPWNLYLATVPFALSLAMRHASRPRAAWTLLPLWLLFLPNAPYLVTDLIHLRPRPGAPLWFDVLLLWSAALAGLFLTYVSLRHVQAFVTQRTNRAAGRLFAVGVLFLSAFGVSLGRFQRWNSWELLTSPLALLQDALHRFFVPWDHPRNWAMTVALGVALSLGYFAIGALTTRAPEPGHESST